MKLTLTDQQIRLLRLRAQRLIPDGSQAPASPEQVLAEVCGVQAQETAASRLGVHAREEGLPMADIDRAQYESRTILRTWCMRGTLHLIPAEDARWLIPLFGPIFIAGSRRRLANLGWNEELTQRGLRLMQDVLSRQGSLTREEIVALLKTHGLPNEGQAPIHLIFRAGLECIVCQGPNRGKQPTFVLFEDWVGAPIQLPRPQAVAQLARRYLQAFGPASLEDMASWSGLPMREVRPAWQHIEDELVAVETTGKPLWLLKTQLAWVEALSARSSTLRLLPRFDLYLLGYANRSLMVAPADYAKYVNPGGGILHSTLTVDGRVVGTWTSMLHRTTLEVHVEPFESFASQLMPPLQAEAASLGRFLGWDAVVKVGVV